MTTPKKIFKTVAYWYIQLEVDCPHCGKYVDLLKYDDFWNDHDGSFQPVENNTHKTIDVEVTCPECKQEFECDFEY